MSVSGASSFKLGTASIDDVRPMRIVIIGAGFSGITAGIRFPQRLQNIDFTIYDKNAGIGGTWLTNKYPGLACDIPSHCYQLTFEENIQWSAFYAPGPEIRAYLEHVVDKFKLMRYIKLQHEIVHARFDEASGKWHLRIRRPMSDAPPGSIQYETFDDTADFVFAGLGALSRWSWPDIPGLNDFKGKLLHSADWETDEKGLWQEGVKDWGDKKIGVIGVGSSGLQIVPALQPRVKHLYNYVRGKTWLAPPFASHKLLELMKRDPNAENYEFTDEDRKSFEDPVLYKQFRHDLESELNSVHFATIRGSEMQKGARIAFKDSMIKRLAKKPWIADHLIPDFSVACRRLTPGPGYLEALCEDNVDFVPTHIKRITETGIELVDGSHHNLDVLICATGYDTSFRYPFSIVGRGGKTLNERFSPHPVTYLTVCTDGFPNWFMSLGPNSGVGSGSLLVLIERQIDFAVAAAMKLQREHLKTIEPKAEAVADFDEYLETVYSEKCRSWYKMGKEEGRIVGLWPGSCLHAVRALTFPRWEDFNYKPLDEPETRNRFYWLGDGSTYSEKYMVGDRAWYLNPEEVDIPPGA
ncbi:FAD/NAD-binding domain-containing protein [Fomitiporia mediterranea MF3/22]|uniref:FAD/NAD-binding domain-containing protein n=1 Tax=Fomitiporia mediterranea (strain MF3/22) TaxID=694068 RepID=UPI0004407BED|nr:FAD/NAD-binding domain-containing protein [Fomitiporia mediterranea MF3/22]EJD00095.1 FAD/NAD-binding domain-containing protein [Fomitiporia mediterranea MF3/22]